MSVVVELEHGTREHVDRTGEEPGDTVRFWYELHPTGGLLIRKIMTTSEVGDD